MKDGVSGFVDFASSSYGITLRVHYAETYNDEANTSDVAITNVQVMSSSSSDFLNYLDGEIAIDGVTAVSMSSFAGSHSVYVSAKNEFYDITGDFGAVSGIVHNSDGTKAVPISVTVSGLNKSGSTRWTISDIKEIALITIARGIVYIDDGTSIDAYQCCIDNGSGFDLFTPFVDNGSVLEMCN